MRAILINPWAQSVEAIEIEPGLTARYAALSGPTAALPGEDPAAAPPAAEVHLVDRAELGTSPVGGETVDLWIDDEGMLAERQAYFQMVDGKTEHQPTFAGRGAILGCRLPEGQTIGTTLTLDMVRAKVRFLPLGTRIAPRPPIIIGADSFESLEFMRKVSGL